ncbi:MAG: glycosyltransferase [Cyanobacteria bacterium P01_F01_bin.33]
MPTVSVIIPAYNCEATILETIASVQRQTFVDFELIVINDGSTDRTLDLLKTLREPRLKVFSYANSGLSTARNRGIERASCEFISFLDADDLWTADKLARQLNALQHNPEAGAVYSRTLVIGRDGNSVYAGTSVGFEGNIYAQLLLDNFIASGSNVMLRRRAIESVGRFDRELRACEDWDYWLRLAARWSFVAVPKPQVLYRQSASSMSAKIDVMEENFLKVFQRAFGEAPAEYQVLKDRSLSNGYLFLSQLCLRYHADIDNMKRARKNLFKSLRLYPLNLVHHKAQSIIAKLLLFQLLPSESVDMILSKLGRVTHLDKYLDRE